MLCVDDTRVLYVSGEESVQQVHMRARRLGIRSPQLYFCRDQPGADPGPDRGPQAGRGGGGLGAGHPHGGAGLFLGQRQPGACAVALAHLAKTLNVAVFLIGHVTKAGSIAGPRVLEHVVDTVLYMEGERFTSTGCCAASRTASAPPTRWASLRCAKTAWYKFPIPRRCSWQSAWSTPPAPPSPSPWRAPAPSSWRYKPW